MANQLITSALKTAKAKGHEAAAARDKPLGTDHTGPFDPRAVHNEILLDLPRNERQSVFAKLDFVPLPNRSVLNEIGKPIEFCYFVNSGLVSLVNVLSDGKSVEVGLTGKEGFVGLSALVGFSVSPTQAVTQIEGTAFRISLRNLSAVLRTCPALERNLHRYAHEVALQATQVAACNRVHRLDKRLARWLLMSQDRVGLSELALTQQTLAHMLGTRRASVTVAAGILQHKGLITYKRGLVSIKNRAGLEKAACECYRQVNEQLRAWGNKSDS
jgi:CRP-like cAMP-binding protein